MTKDEVLTFLKSKGYVPTPLTKKGGTKNLYYVHPHRTGRRYVLSKIMIRLEKKIDDGWWKSWSGYYKDLEIANGVLSHIK